MFRQYFKQAFHLLMENKLLSAISIAGTALAISVVMVIIILLYAKTANYEPEMNRDRTLYVKCRVFMRRRIKTHVITAACLFMIYSKFSILSRLQKPYLPSVNMGVCSLWFRGRRRDQLSIALYRC